MTTLQVLELNPSDLGTLELDAETWVSYIDLYGEVPFVPTLVRVGADEFAFNTSFIVFGSGATMPQKIRELRAAGKKVLVIQRGASGSGHSDRYLVFISPA
ncbi:MAG: hypothetical protein HY873_11440 [Chloroflexi bacterium]|nr:hypothetical protein [Chloroflexota bacterium]